MQNMSREGQVAAGPTQYQKRHLNLEEAIKECFLLYLSHNDRIEFSDMHKYRDDI